MLPALLVHQHLLADLLGLVRLFQKVDFQVVFEEVGHGLGDELVGDGLFGLVLVAGAGGKAGRHIHQAVLDVLEADRALPFLVHSLVLQVLVDLVDKGGADGVLGAAAVLQPGGVVIKLQQLHLVGKTEGGAHPHLIVGLVLPVAAGGLRLAGEHRGQRVGPGGLPDIVGDAVFVAVALLPGLAGGGVGLFFVGKGQSQPCVDHRLAAQHIFIIAGRHVDVGEHLVVRLPVDDAAGAAALVGLLFQAAHVLAPGKVQVIVEAVPVDVGGHPGRRILGGAQAQTIQAQAELIVVLALAVLAAGVHLAEQQLPVVAALAAVPVHRHSAAKVLHPDAAVLAAGHVDDLAVAVPGLVDGVGDDLKDGVGAAVHAVRAEDDCRALADPVGPLQRSNALVAVFLFFCHVVLSVPSGKMISNSSFQKII